MATKTKATAVQTNGKAVKADDSNTVKPEHFDVVIRQTAGNGKWRWSVEANADHPTDSGEVAMGAAKTLQGAADAADGAILAECE